MLSRAPHPSELDMILNMNKSKPTQKIFLGVFAAALALGILATQVSFVTVYGRVLLVWRTGPLAELHFRDDSHEACKRWGAGVSSISLVSCLGGMANSIMDGRLIARLWHVSGD